MKENNKTNNLIIFLSISCIIVFTYSTLNLVLGRHDYDDDEYEHPNIVPTPIDEVIQEKIHRKAPLASNLVKNENNFKNVDLKKRKRSENQKNIDKLKINFLDDDDNQKVIETIEMAMDKAKPRMKIIKETHQFIIKNQNRAPDSRYNINVTNSDLQSLDREIPDTRPPICKTFKYDFAMLPKASVIIPIYNEALSMLLRTVHSLLNRSPDSLLQEIILVDDCSPDEHLQKPLADYVKLLPKVQLVRNEKRQGLIVSRMRGARMAKGPVLIFLDAHSEANEMWLEPLLDEIRKNRKQILQPFTDAIDAMSLKISDPGEYHKGSFSWDLRYTWIKATEYEQNAASETGLPFFTPTLVGCAIAVDKNYFEELGNFDEGLKVWGGENIELGFRTWMCGGKVTTVTCSHMGHVFKEFPYTFDGDKEEIVQKNLIRVTETWMDGMRKYFYASTRIFDYKRAELNEEELASLEARKLLRKKLGCKNFEWYMYNIIPQLEEPPMEAKYYGEVTNQNSHWCWEITEDYYLGMTYVCYHHKIIPNNYFSLTKEGLMKYRDKCISIQSLNPVLKLEECPIKDDIGAVEAFGVWSFNPLYAIDKGLISLKIKRKDILKQYCLEQVTNAVKPHKGSQMPQLSNCNKKNKFQHWGFTYAFDFSMVPPHAL